MKLNTAFFICLFFSTIIAIKAQGNDEDDDVDETFESTQEHDDDDQNVGEETSGAAEVHEIEQGQRIVKFKPSERLARAESGLEDSRKAFVGDGMAKETLENTFADAMSSKAAANGWKIADREWQLMLAGPEASRLIDTFGRNFNRFVTSSNGADMANAVASTAHTLLARAGAETRHSGLGDVVSMTTSLFRSPKMPEIVSMAGGLILTSVNKNNALAFINQFWVEMESLLATKNLNGKLQTSFDNLTTAMDELVKKQTTDNGAPTRNQRRG